MDYYVQLLSTYRRLNPGTRFIVNRILNRDKYVFMEEAVRLLRRVNELGPDLEKKPAEELRASTARFRERLAAGETLDDILPEAFALVREAARRQLSLRHFDVQIIGGIVLHRGNVAEMTTGEGKTLVATLPIYLNALAGKGVHLVTVNDYLAKRDTQWMGPIYHLLGLSTGCIISYKEAKDPSLSYPAFVYDPDYLPTDSRYLCLRPIPRAEAYRCDITYGVGSEFGFDYLRDNMAVRKEAQVQRPLHYAIVDEVDSILIDEARTPLIISGPSDDAPLLYYEIDRLVRKLVKETDYSVDEEAQVVALTEDGVRKCERLLNIQNLYDGSNTERVHHITQALRAHTFFRRDKEYVVKDGGIVIVDEFTGRLMPGRRWSDGLHQAVEAKEGVRIESENQTLATISFQNYFRLYDKVAGMTGTAMTEGLEFKEIYKLSVFAIPTNKDLKRTEHDDEIYRSEREKLNAITGEIAAVHASGRPVLVGTISIEKAEKLSKMLRFKNIPHQVLHGRNHEAEAAVIAQAGRPGTVTIATQMAGRGVDIILGGNPEVLAREETIKTIWTRRAADKPRKDRKDFGELIAETEEAYKKSSEALEKSFRERLDELKGRLTEAERRFSGMDRDARETWERELFEAKGGEEYRRQEARLGKLRERYAAAAETDAQLQVEFKNKPERLKDSKENVNRAYKDLEGLKAELRHRFGIAARQDVEERRSLLLHLLENPPARLADLRRDSAAAAAAVAAVLDRHEENLRLVLAAHGGDAHGFPAEKTGARYRALFDRLRELLAGDVAGQERAIVAEFLDGERAAYRDHTAALEEVDRRILTAIAGDSFAEAEKAYRKALEAYEEEQADYSRRATAAREEYEKVRSRYEEEWQAVREDLEKSPEEFGAAYREILEKYRQPWIKDHDKVVAAGGLHVIGSERYEARRIDNQLKGRAGRQGDPGSSRFYLSLDDDLLRIFGAERLNAVMRHLPEGENITHPLITKMINNSQRKVEARNFEIRKQLLEFDNVLNEQRKIVYTLRQDVLEGRNVEQYVEASIEESIGEAIESFLDVRLPVGQWNLDGLRALCRTTFGMLPEIGSPDSAANPSLWRADAERTLREEIGGFFARKRAEMGPYFPDVARILLLQVIDNRWKAHLRAMDELREGIQLRAYAQKDPLIAYKQEGYQMFQELLQAVRQEALSYMFKVQVSPDAAPVDRMPAAPRRVAEVHRSIGQFAGMAPETATAVAPEESAGLPSLSGFGAPPPLPLPEDRPQPVRAGRKVGRNEPCPCGSGKKYKQCCGKGA